MTDTTVELALLAMDSYDQGYSVGLAGLPQGIGGQIGDATVIYESDTEVGSIGVNAGFYAVAYRLGDGTTVISYRGTDAAIGRAIELSRLH